MSDRWRLLRLQNNELELVILPGIGGRLWDVVFHGQSLLFQNPDLNGIAFDDTDLADLPTRAPQYGFPLWGGEKTWIAPDTLWHKGSPFPALDSGPYQVTSQSDLHVEVISTICPISQLSVTRRITLTSSTTWRIAHTVTNHGAGSRTAGIWSVMMIDTPATIGVAMDKPEVSPVFGVAGSQVMPTPTGVVAQCAVPQEFKVGLPCPDGQTFITFGKTGPLLTCTTPPPMPEDNFAHGHPVEVFNSGDYPYCEAEWHSPARDLKPGQHLQFRQDFELWPNDAPPSSTRHKDLLSCMF
ncbi:hypothetical protein [Pacificoceanicola onchidii]|uniref:hypothetical protein n=1 Tax=Pacificoceanicola onchidii TaxID=2562685 RepID=UPI0010A3012A|nr:hypothetical protein [Pacificoceanicola onchidii]